MELAWVADRLPKERRALAAKAASILRLIDDTIQSVHRIAAGLRPAVSDQLGLAAAIEWQAKDFRRRSGIRCKVSLPADIPVLDQERTTAMFRVCQELLTNVARHAGATRVEIELRVDSGRLALSVEDNGKGIADSLVVGPKTLGFLGMRERLRLVGGGIEIEQGRVSGARVNAFVPLG
jgi:signal transduction histidine kinase